jgi:hypothetical protein
MFIFRSSATAIATAFLKSHEAKEKMKENVGDLKFILLEIGEGIYL